TTRVQPVFVIDPTPPVITTCPAAQSANADDNCQAALPDFRTGLVALDNCTPANALVITQSPAAGSSVSTGITTVTLTVKDAAGNTSTCTTTFTVTDVTPPW